MNIRLTPKSSRWLALVLLVLTIGLVYFLTINPLFKRYKANTATIDQLNSRLTRYQQLVNRRASLEQQIAGINKNQQTKKYYLKNKTESLAAAELQSRISKLVSTSGGTMISTQPLNTMASGLLPRIRVRVRINADIEALRKIVYSLETGTPFLFVDNFSVSAKGRHVSRKSGKDAKRPLNIQFELSGYIRLKNS